ncbi:MAG: hypothetical protein WCC60_05505 [Ilumatobacteraceae bacterium]
MSHRHAAAAAALLLAVAACSSDPKVVGGTEPVAATTAPAGTTTMSEQPTTTALPGTTAPPVTAAPPETTAAGSSTDPRLVVEPLGIDGQCSEAGCTSVAITLTGEVVTYDSATSTLTFTESGRSLVTPGSLGDLARLVLMGPDDVAYIAGVPPEATDPVEELIAVSTSGATAGQEVARVGGLDGSGDSVLIATAAGVTQVGCCGFDGRLPAADAAPAMAWVTPAGAPSGVIVPEVHLEYPGDGTTIVVRTAVDGGEQRWTVPAMLAGRDMPPVAATDDGGALVWMYDPIGAPEVPAVLYDLRPSGAVETFDVGDIKYVAAMHASRVLIATDGETSYVRIVLP